MKKGVFLLLVLSLTSFIPAQDNTPVTIHLELSKDTLALAEPVMLSIRVVNNKLRGVPIAVTYEYEYFEPHFKTILTLLEPDGSVVTYGNWKPLITYSDVICDYYYRIPAKSSTIDYRLMCWDGFLYRQPYTYSPGMMRQPLSSFEPGVYSLFGTFYTKDRNTGFEDTVYSDTLRFVFLPFEDVHEHEFALIDSLGLGTRGFDEFVLNIKGNMPILSEAIPALKEIMSSSSPYSEATNAYLISILSYSDSLEYEKNLFDLNYPQSQFSGYILSRQYSQYRQYNMHRTVKFPELETKSDSLLSLLKKRNSRSLQVLRWTKPRRFFAVEKIDSR